jgi:adenosylcobinamide kinase / adenosylcobinamide-phosphate guanylyltransferase
VGLRLAGVTLVLGGARSGKSRFAETLVEASGLEPVYLATAGAGDAEMAARIARHRARRDRRWATVEEQLELAATLRREAALGRALLVDCLTLWLANLMAAGRDPSLEGSALVEALTALPGPVVLVSNEVGQGVVPVSALARAFVDHAGLLHQEIAARADRVVLVTAGLPQDLKPAKASP